MMIRAAGGPGLVSPLDYAERKTRLPKATWIAIGIVAGAHVAVGIALYYQRFELPMSPVVESAPIGTILIDLPTPKPPEPLPSTEQPAPTPPVNRPTVLHNPTEVLQVPVVDRPVVDNPGPVISFHPQPDAAPTGTATTPVTPAPPRTITSPSWSRQPNADQMARAYPPRALENGVSGSVGMDCLIMANGSVSDCRVTRETPDGQGFGRAAQTLSRYFRLNPRTVDGVAEGSRVNIGLRFQPPAD